MVSKPVATTSAIFGFLLEVFDAVMECGKGARG
jgi:hypothetical protein